MSGRDPVDFFEIRPVHVEIHARLQNWARWSRGGRGWNSVLPMFQNYRPDGYYELAGGTSPIDNLDALKLQKIFIAIPEKHRWAIQWHYSYSFISPTKVCRALAVSKPGLSELVHDARSMLKNNSHTSERSYATLAQS